MNSQPLKPAPRSTSAPLEHTDAIRRVVTLLERSVGEQFQQLDQMIDELVQLAGTEGDASGAWQELEEQRTDWVHQCESVSQQVQQEYRLLAEAWERLEQQQRQSAGTRVSGQVDFRMPGQAPSSPYDTNTIPLRPSPVEAAPVHQSATPSQTGSGELDICDAWSPRLNDSAVVQFQQMKRQIRSHVADSRRK